MLDTYLANIGKNNLVLEKMKKKKIIKFICWNGFQILIFEKNTTLIKSKMKIIRIQCVYWNLIEWLAKKQISQIIIFFFHFHFRFAISESMRFFWAIVHWIHMIVISLQLWDFEKSKFSSHFSKKKFII